MTIIGGAIDELETLKAGIDQRNTEVHDLADGITNLLAGTNWQGPAADRFRDAWTDQYLPALTNLETALTDASSEVQSRTQALIEAGS